MPLACVHHVNGVMPGLGLILRFKNRHDPSVRQDNIDFAELLDARVVRGLYVGSVPDIADRCQNGATDLLD
jgi:hypothetical protein